MNTQRTWLIAVLAAIAITFTGSAGAARLSPSQTVTGQLSSVSAQSVTINGQSYAIRPGSYAAQVAGQLQAGQQVEATLDGPSSSPDSQVVVVRVITPPPSGN